MTGNTPGANRRAPSYRIQPSDVPTIEKRIREGEFLNPIAADYDVNPRRSKRGIGSPISPPPSRSNNGEAKRKLRLSFRQAYLLARSMSLFHGTKGDSVRYGHRLDGAPVNRPSSLLPQLWHYFPFPLQGKEEPVSKCFLGQQGAMSELQILGGSQ